MAIKRNNHILDIILLLLIIAAGFWIVHRIETVLNYKWHWGRIPQFFFQTRNGGLRPNILMQGFLTTIRLSFWVSVLAILIGTIGGILGSGKSLFWRLVVRTYVEFIRNTPSLVLIFIFYFFIGSQVTHFLGLDNWISGASPNTKLIISIFFSSPQRFPEFFSAILTLSLYEGAYVTEIVRGGLKAIPKGQFEASYTLGLSVTDTYFFVILPQVFKNILPSLTGQVISAIKDSSIVSVISIQELTFQGMQLMTSTYYIFEIWITITALYFLLTFTLSHLANRIEKKLIH